MMEERRRRFLLGSGVVAGSAAVVGYKETLGAVALLKDKGERAKDSIYGEAAEPEVRFESGRTLINPKYLIRPSVCNGCTTHCGIRVKINQESGAVERVFGNPYSLLSSDPWLPYNTPLKESLEVLSAQKESGLHHRSTACARGNAVYDKLNDSFRVTKPLKRVGKRGENAWVEISPEQLIQEIVEGGNLFGEGEVEGLRSIRQLDKLIDEENPEYGSSANRLCVLGTADEGRQVVMVQRFVQSFGTVNFMGHTSICGLSMRAGEAAYLNDFVGYPHLKPDFKNCKFLLNIGTAPAHAGNPFKRQAKLLAQARTTGECRYVTVTPILANSDNIAVGERSRWLPIAPSGDLALVMGMIRLIIEEKRYLADYLAIPSLESQKALEEVSFTNATHLIIQKGEKEGQILKDSQGSPWVIDAKEGVLRDSKSVLRGELDFAGEVTLEGVSYEVKSAFLLLKESALAYTLEEYASFSGIDSKEIVHLAREFTSYGRSVGVDCHGGTMHTTGFYTTYAVMMLGALVGNLNHKGGMSMGGGKFEDFNGEAYNLIAYPNKPKPQGARIDRARMAYEKTSEFKRKVAQGENPYPAKAPWYGLANALESDVITNSEEGYPYKLGALISWCANFIYGQSGSEHLLESLKDPKRAIPLFIAIDPFINETSRWADYIVPDSVMYETWGVVSPWGASLTKASHLRYPILPSPNAKWSNGEPVSMDSFIIELGKALGLPGFGKNGIVAKSGEKFPFDRPEELYLRAFENIALSGKAVPEISDEEIELAGLKEYVSKLQAINGENWRRVAYVMARGGRFAPIEDAYKGDSLSRAYPKAISIYNEALGTSKNSLTGERYSGVPRFYAPRFTDGRALEEAGLGDSRSFLAFSYKSNVLSAPTTASRHLKELRYTTFVDMNSQSAKALGIVHGERVRVVSKGGFVIGICRLREGIHPRSIGIEHGAGREGEGAIDLFINGNVIRGEIARRSGVNINKLGLKDASKGKAGILSDFVIGSNARQGIPVWIEKLS